MPATSKTKKNTTKKKLTSTTSSTGRSVFTKAQQELLTQHITNLSQRNAVLLGELNEAREDIENNNARIANLEDMVTHLNNRSLLKKIGGFFLRK